MDSFELNKILGAILGTLLFVMGVGFLAESIYHPTAIGAGSTERVVRSDARGRRQRRAAT